VILLDSQAAIAAVRKAGRTGKARTAELRKVMMDIGEGQTRLGANTMSFRWVRAHNEVHGNEMADTSWLKPPPMNIRKTLRLRNED